jgi:aminopeptidase N
MAHRTARSLALAALLSSLSTIAAGEAKTTPGGARATPRYELAIRVDPSTGTVEGRARIEAPGADTFSLARELTVRRVVAEGKSAAFTEGTTGADAGLREVRLAGASPRRLTIEYGGRLDPAAHPQLVSLVNGVHPEYVELAGYVGWYPRLKGAAAFRFELTADVPGGFVAVVNGRPDGRGRQHAGRAVTRWRSDAPVSDILLFAAPGLQRTTASAAGLAVEIFSTALPHDYVQLMATNLAAAGSDLAALAGRPSPSDVVRVVYSPRPGWGYVRTPLIVVSEKAALAAREQRFGPGRDLRYISHEIAHYWWNRADTATPEDWLNEGLAEYCALLTVGKRVSPEFAELLLQEYRRRSDDSATTTAIAETPNGSPDRELNRYTRPVLLLDDAQRRYGTERVTAFLHALGARFTGRGGATTAAFLDEAEAQLGPEARATFREALYRRSWGKARQPYAYTPADAAFLGTWTASLSQAGETHQVVLHLVEKGGTLLASLDSPDQGAREIPVPSVRLDGNRLRFALAAFGVSYEGTLSGPGDAIEGAWTQGGVATPLSLSREQTEAR